MRFLFPLIISKPIKFAKSTHRIAETIRHSGIQYLFYTKIHFCQYRFFFFRRSSQKSESVEHRRSPYFLGISYSPLFIRIIHYYIYNYNRSFTRLSAASSAIRVKSGCSCRIEPGDWGLMGPKKQSFTA